MTNEIKARALLTRMDVPAHKVEPVKNVKWLLSQLRVRNVRHADYAETMELLLQIAVAARVINKTERVAYEEHLRVYKEQGPDAVIPAPADKANAEMREAGERPQSPLPLGKTVPRIIEPSWTPAGDTTNRPARFAAEGGVRPKITVIGRKELDMSLAARTERALAILRAASRQ